MRYSKKSLALRKLWRKSSFRRDMSKREPVSFWKGKRLSKSHRLAISKGGKGRKFSREHRRKIGEANSKRIWSEESREKSSKTTRQQMTSRKRRYQAGSANRGKSTWNKGKHWSSDILRKIFSKAATHPNGLERKMMKILDKLSIEYEFQPVVGQYVPDFLIRKSGYSFLFEADGMYWHRKRNRKRDRILRGFGYKVFHFREQDIRREPERVAAQIRELLRSNS